MDDRDQKLEKLGYPLDRTTLEGGRLLQLLIEKKF
jgi:hypothetical protein